MKHGPLLGFFILVLAFSQTCWSAASTSAPPPNQTETLQLLKSDGFAELDRRFSAVQAAYRSGSISDEDLRAAFRVFYNTDGSLGPKYDAWVAKFPKSYVANLARGIYFKRVGLERRGDASFASTSRAQMRGMYLAFPEAEKSLVISMRLDPKPLLSYLHTMDITRHRGAARETRQLLELSIGIDRRNFIVREKYIDTLRRRWGGSLEEMADLIEESRQAGVSAPHLRKLQDYMLDEKAYQLQSDDDPKGAIRIYREMESRGSDFCRRCYAHALAVDRQYGEALTAYNRVLAESPDNASSIGRRGEILMLLKRPAEGISDLKAAASMGDAYAQGQLGYHYMKSVPGVLDEDPEVGLEWLRKSAAQGDEMGKRYLGQVEKWLREHPNFNVKTDRLHTPKVR